mgnify:FL=1
MAVGRGIGPVGTMYHPRMEVIQLANETYASTDDPFSSGVEIDIRRFRTGLCWVDFDDTVSNADEVAINIQGALTDTSAEYVTLHTFAATTDGGAFPAAAVVTLFPFMRIQIDNTDGSSVGSITVDVRLGV